MKEEKTRQFKRYTIESECEVRIGSEKYNGIAFSFSEGVGVTFENAPQLEKGVCADIKIFDYDIELKAEAVWIKEEDNNLKVGFRRHGNFKGNLKHYRFPDILFGISRGKKTGVLEVTSGSTVKKIFIKNGDKLFATSNNKDDRLGEYLLKQGKITLEEFNQASYLVIKTEQRLGKVLVDLGYLKANELYQSVQNQIEEIVVSLFVLEEGKFEFKEGPLSKDESITLQISSANLVYKGIKKINNFVHVKKMSPSVDTIFNLSNKPMQIFQSLTLENHDKEILSLVNGINPLKIILSLSPSTNFATLKTICSLLSIGLIHVKEDDETPSKLPLSMIFGDLGEEETVKFKENKPEVNTVADEQRNAEEAPDNPEAVELSEEVITATEKENIISGNNEADNEKKDPDLTSSSESGPNMEEMKNDEVTNDNTESMKFSEEAGASAEADVKDTGGDMEEKTNQNKEPVGLSEEAIKETVEYIEKPVEAEVNESEEEEPAQADDGFIEETTEETLGVEDNNITRSPDLTEGETVTGYHRDAEETTKETAEPVELSEEKAAIYCPIDGTILEKAEEEEKTREEKAEPVGLSEETITEASEYAAESAEAENNVPVSVEKDDCVIEETTEEAEGFEEESDKKELNIISHPEAEAVMEEARDIGYTRIPEPDEIPEEIIAAEGAGESAHGYDGAAEGLREEDEFDLVREIADDFGISEKRRPRKKLPYVSFVLLFIVLLAACMYIVYDIDIFDNIKQVSPSAKLPDAKEKISVSAVEKTAPLPSSHKTTSVKAPLETSERTTPFPVFREDALRKLLEE